MSWYDLADLNVKCRPIDLWPGQLTPHGKRTRSPFGAQWRTTVRDLAAELRALRGRSVVLQLALDESQIVGDGSRPYADATTEHPGVIISFESSKGPLRFCTDLFTTWQDNVRAIALGMQGIRRLERYGITRRDEHYRGWRALPDSASVGMASGPVELGGMRPDSMTIEEAAQIIAEAHSSPPPPHQLIESPEILDAVYKDIARRLHPDVTGGRTGEQFGRINRARLVLEAYHQQMQGVS